MCPACLTVAALTAAKIAGAGGITAYGIKKWLARAPVLASDSVPCPEHQGDSNETANDRVCGTMAG